jgi:hypothetical protein
MHRDFWSNIDPGKTHKGKTSERGIFIIFRAQRNSSVTAEIFTAKIYTNLSQKK